MQRERQEDVVLNKVLWWIVGAVVLEFLLLLLNRFYSYYTPDGIALAQALRTVFTVLGIVLPLCFLALLAWYRSARRSGKGTRLSGALTLIACGLRGGHRGVPRLRHPVPLHRRPGGGGSGADLLPLSA